MHSQHYFGVLGPAECDRAIELLHALPAARAATESGISVYRSGIIRWLERTPDVEWLFTPIEDVGRRFAGTLGIDVDKLGEPLQFAEYRKSDSFDWHIDTGNGESESRCRKIAVSLQLSSGNDYRGGTLEFVGEFGSVWRRSRGCATVFPTVLGHRLTPVTDGTRIAAVGWLHGPPYR